jgi:ABC-type lipoprotein release transport system permease subunit
LHPPLLGGVALRFGLVALSARILPATRAMKVDPVVVLSEQ